MKASKIIDKNRSYFDNCLKTAETLIDGGHLEVGAQYLEKLATFAYGNCTGYYTNWNLEKLLNKLGSRLTHPSIKQEGIRNQRPRVLHVATELYKLGGHTRLLLNWVSKDTTRDHTIFITNQRESFPIDLIESFSVDKSIFTVVDTGFSYLNRAKILREVSCNYDFIILHSHPNDIIPVIAFSTVNLPAIGYLNHADHIFWIGASVSDLLIQFRESTLEVDSYRRKVNNQTLLPIPVPEISRTSEKDYLESRRRIGVEPETIFLLTVGSEYKFRETPEHNFFQTVIPVLNQNKNAVLYVVGVPPDSDIAVRFLHPQIIYLGIIGETLEEYEKGCDIYLEPFPLGSITAMLHPAKRGKTVHLMHNPLPLATFFYKHEVDGFEYKNSSEEWSDELIRLINDRKYRFQKGTRQYQLTRNVFSEDFWKFRLEQVYLQLSGLNHEIHSRGNSCFLNGKNEQALTHMDFKWRLNHFDLSPKSGFKTKLRHISYAFSKPETVHFSKKDLLKFLISSN